jgi:NAD(P)H-flavin reductase
MQELGVGDVIGVRGPYGAGWPLSDAQGRDVVVIAGGLGLAPLRPLVHAVLARRKEFARVVLLYGARTPRDIPFKPDLRRWRFRSDLDVEMTVDRAGGRWDGDIGVVTRLVARAPFDPGNTVAYVCGPEVMMRFAVRELERRGVAGNRIHVSLERNMRCAVGFCGHCQYGPQFVCKDGPVFRFDRVRPLLNVGEL